MRSSGFRSIARMAVALIGVVLLPALHPTIASADAITASDTALNSMWNAYGNQGGHWTGADSTVSIALPDGRIAWLFSDTFLGTVNSDYSRPQNTPLIHNSMVVQQGSTLTTLTGGTAAAPTSLVGAATDGPNDAGHWVGDAFIVNGRLDVFYNHYQRTGTGALDIQQIGTEIAEFSLPALSLLSLTELPVATTVNWGTDVLDQSDYTYIYGIEGSGLNKFLHLARAPHGQVLGAASAPTAAWQFWTGSGWSATEADSTRIMSGVGDGFGIGRVNGQVVLVTQDTNFVFSPNIVSYTAIQPWGPFGSQTYLYHVPEATGNQIMYGPRLHLELSGAGELVVSYNVNSLVSSDNYADARIYRPRFIDVTWPYVPPSPSSVPGAPTSLTASTDSLGLEDLSWTAPASGGVTGYWVYLQDVTAGQTQPSRLATPVTSGTSLTLGTLVNGDTYRVTVTAYNANGESPPSNSVNAVESIAAPTTPPANLSAVPNSDGTVALTWSPVAAPSVYYRVYQRDDTAGQTSFQPWVSRVFGTSATAQYLNEGHQYEFEVSAGDPGGEGPLSAPVTATSHAQPPPAPTGLSATANSDGSITLSWTAPAPGLWYWIYWRDDTAGQTSFTRSIYPVTNGATTFTVTYLTVGDQYSFSVTAINAGGEGPPSNTAQATSFMALPPAPTGLTATANNDGTIALSWTSPGPNLWYWVYERDVTANQGGFTRLKYPVTSGSTLTVAFLTVGHQYAFYVTAINAGGEGPASNTVQATAYAPPPSAPTDLDAQPGNGKVALAWTPPAPGLWYWIYYRDVTANQTSYTRTQYPLTSGTNFTLTYLTNGDTYDLYVTSIGIGGESGPSNVVQATPTAPPPMAPVDLAATAGNGQVTLTWTAPQANVWYWIYWRDVTAGQTTFTRSQYPVTSGTSFTLTYLTNGDWYEFYVTSIDSGGESPPSNKVRARPLPPLPAAPTGLSATVNNDGTITLSWNAPGPSVWYWIYWKDVDAGVFTRSQYPLTSGTTFTVSYLTIGDPYDFYVTAINLAGESPASNVVRATPYYPPPPAPTNLTASAGDGRVALSWNAPASNVWFWIYWRDASRGQTSYTRSQFPLSTGTSFTVTFLTDGDWYNFFVTAVGPGGEGPGSNVASARPMPPLPQAPSNLTSSSGIASVTLWWNASPTPNVLYWIYFRDISWSETSWTRSMYPVTGSPFTLRDAFWNGDVYEFKVTAVNLAGESGPSNSVAAIPLYTKLQMAYRLEQPNDGSWTAWNDGFNDNSLFAIYDFDWSTDYCSPPSPPNGPPGLDFQLACARHDFGYRNFKAMGAFPQYKGMIDGTFYWGMMLVCDIYPSFSYLYQYCVTMAYTYWALVSAFGT